MLLTETQLDPRIQRTRELLGQALMGLLSHKEFDKITVQKITAQAGVNRATFYAHFEDKYALIDYVLRERFQTTLRGKLGDRTEFTNDSLRALTLVACEFLGGFVGHCKPNHAQKNNTLLESQVQMCLYEILLVWLNADAPAHTKTPEFVANVVSWVIFGSVSQWAHKHKRIPAEQLSDEVLGLLTTGLRPLLG